MYIVTNNYYHIQVKRKKKLNNDMRIVAKLQNVVLQTGVILVDPFLLPH